jgi:hypothetical protein
VALLGLERLAGLKPRQFILKPLGRLRVNPYDALLAMVDELAAEFHEVAIRRESLHGTHDVGDQLILTRQLGADVRVVRVPATDDAVRAFYFAHHPPPGQMGSFPQHGEGHRFGETAYIRQFLRCFLFELADWDDLPMSKPDGSFP